MSKDPTNGIKVLKEMLQKRKKTTKTTKYTYPQTIMYTQRDIRRGRPIDVIIFKLQQTLAPSGEKISYNFSYISYIANQL